MTNAQAPMTSQTANSNDECRELGIAVSFLFHWSLVLGHWSFGVPIAACPVHRH
jgi:hypothetical protein